MTSKEVIKLLQELDPTGETEVSVGNHAISYINEEPAYYDGKLQSLLYDADGQIIGIKYKTQGSKLVISEMGVTDLLWENPEAIVDYSEIPEHGRERYKISDEATRDASRNVELNLAMDHFYEWCKKKAIPIRDEENIRYKSKSFFERYLSPGDPVKKMPQQFNSKGNYWFYPSWNERQEATWEDTIEITWRGEWVIKKKEI